MKRGVTIGLSVAPDRLTALTSTRPRGAREVVVAVTELADLTAPSLVRAFDGLADTLEADSVTAHVSIMPPLVELKTLQMPRVGRRTLAEILERRAAHSFMSACEVCVVGVEPLAPGRRSPVRVAATCASEGLIEDLLSAADEAGWTVASIVSGYDALAAGLSQAKGRASREFVTRIRHDDISESLHVVDGRACCVRRQRGPNETSPKDTGPACGATDVPEADPAGDGDATSFPHVAARHAEHARGPELAPSSRRRARITSGRRLGAGLLGTAALLLILAGWAEHQGVQRELAHVQTARSAIAPRVEAVLAKRDQAATFDRGLTLLTTLEASAPDWTGIIADLAERLPPDASLSWMHGLADSVRIEGTARDASSVLESLRQSSVLSRVRAEAPFEREATERGNVERFRLAAAITPRSVRP